jgi:hypothetical protein
MRSGRTNPAHSPTARGRAKESRGSASPRGQVNHVIRWVTCGSRDPIGHVQPARGPMGHVWVTWSDVSRVDHVVRRARSPSGAPSPQSHDRNPPESEGLGRGPLDHAKVRPGRAHAGPRTSRKCCKQRYGPCGTPPARRRAGLHPYRRAGSQPATCGRQPVRVAHGARRSIPGPPAGPGRRGSLLPAPLNGHRRFPRPAVQYPQAQPTPPPTAPGPPDC